LLNTTEFVLCLALTALGSIGMGLAHLSSTNERVEFPFGTLLSLLGLVTGIFLSWHWFDAIGALTIVVVSLMIAVALVRTAGRYTQFMWLAGQAVLLSWGAWQMFDALQTWSSR
jgi:hypothetical protein